MIELITFGTESLVKDIGKIHRESLVDAITDITGMHNTVFLSYIDIDGRTTKYYLEKLKIEFNLSDTELLLISEKKDYYLTRHLYRDIYPIPEQIEMLNFLGEKYSLIITSNSGKESTIRLLNIMGITNIFQHILTNNDVDNPKPDPEIFIRALEITGTAINNMLIIEKSKVGQTAAKKVGSPLICVTDPEILTVEYIENIMKNT